MDAEKPILPKNDQKEAVVELHPKSFSPSTATKQAPSTMHNASKPFVSISSISIKTSPKVETLSHIAVEVEQLTEENLLRYWKEAAEKLNIQELMSEGVPRLGEHPGQFEVDAQTVSFDDEFKLHKIDVMEFIRARTGMKALDCKVNPRFVEKTEVLYTPEDKYTALLERNPQLEHLHKLFPLIDY